MRLFKDFSTALQPRLISTTSTALQPSLEMSDDHEKIVTPDKMEQNVPYCMLHQLKLVGLILK